MRGLLRTDPDCQPSEAGAASTCRVVALYNLVFGLICSSDTPGFWCVRAG